MSMDPLSMQRGPPVELSRLLRADTPAERNGAWEAFLGVHSRLLLHVARRVGHDYDAAMDAYAFLLEQLRSDDFHRLRSYEPDGRTKFTTWLVVVARRLCADFARRKYGRFRSTRAASADQRAARRQLTDLIAVELDDARTPLPDGGANPEQELIAREDAGRVAAAIAQLDTADQLLLKLRFEDDRTLKEIAPVLGFASGLQVHRHLRRVLDRMRAMLAARPPKDSAR